MSRLRTAALAPRHTTVALICAVFAVFLGAFAANYAIPPDSGVSILVRIATDDPLAELARHDDPDFDLVARTTHYDGSYFYAIARDPLARGTAHHLIDEAAYRYGHPFYGQLAWALSLGEGFRVPWALLLLSLAGLGIAAYCASRLAVALGWSPWAGLVVALSPGLIYATTVDTSEAVGAAGLGLALLAWQRRRFGLAALAFGGLALTKESFVLVPLGVLAFEVARVWRRERRVLPRNWADRRNRIAAGVAALGVAPFVLAAWLIYVREQLGAWPPDQHNDLSLVPFAGIRDALREAGTLSLAPYHEAQLGSASVPLIAVLVVAMLAGTVAALRLRTVFDGAFLATGPLVFLLGPDNLLYPKDLLRGTVVPVLLLPAVLYGARGVQGASLRRRARVAQPT